MLKLNNSENSKVQEHPAIDGSSGDVSTFQENEITYSSCTTVLYRRNFRILPCTARFTLHYKMRGKSSALPSYVRDKMLTF